MSFELQNILLRWPKRLVRDVDLAPLLSRSDAARHNLLKRAVKEKLLIRIMRGVYVIAEPYAKGPMHPFEVAQMLQGPSYISFESALSHHQLIPEAVYTTCSATCQRSKEIHSEIGAFSFQHLPIKNFFLGVERIVEGQVVYLMATPWRALADHYFVLQRPWVGLKSVLEDLRIDEEDLAVFSLEPLKKLVIDYPSPRVRQLLKQFLIYMESNHGQ